MCPKISVIMPIYNPNEIWLKEAVNSILNQTYTDFELIIINDGSKNDVNSMMSEFSDDRIKYVKNETNMGLPATLNKGILLSQGEFIARMDQDDISYSTRFEKQVSFLDQNPKISLVGTWIKYFPVKKIIKSPETPMLFDFLQECVISHPTVMFRKSDFEKYGLKYNESLYTAEDYELWVKAVKFLKFANIQEILLDYRISSGTMTAVRKKEQLEIIAKIKRKLLDSIVSDKVLRNKIIKTVEDNIKINMTFLEKIFSLKKIYSIDKTYKNISILGLNFKVFCKKYPEVFE